jgi:hypothetical protein
MQDLQSIATLLRMGVIDLRLTGITVLGSENERDVGPGATGVQSVIGPFMVDRFVAALSCLVVSKATVFERDVAELRFVLAQPWRLQRMARCISQRSDGPPPPIDVNRISFPGLPDFYEVLNGCHRSFAARRFGDTTINVLVHSHYTCDPDAFFVSGRSLLREHGGDREPVSPADPTGPAVPLDRAALELDILLIMNALGCRSAAAPRGDATEWPFTFDL